MPFPLNRHTIASPLVVIILFCGCASRSEFVTLRETPHHPLAGRFDMLPSASPGPTERTTQLLRRHNLEPELNDDRILLLSHIEKLKTPETGQENEYALAELAYLGGRKAEASNPQRAINLYGAALLHAHRFLFDESDGECNPYDPQFRGACDLYNQSLERLLRRVQAEGDLRPGERRTLQTEGQACSFDVKFFSTGWHEEDFDRFEFVSDYQVNGLRNHYRTFGLGVPLIAIRRAHESPDPGEAYYPQRLSFPVTAFLRINESESMEGIAQASHSSDSPTCPAPRFVLELHDSLDSQTIEVAQNRVPLESDLSTPLAYFLNQPALREETLSTLGLLKPDSVSQLQGLYMLEPYHPDKMPVLMVHGLWSSPVTWMEMFNDLRSDPEIRKRYQFWFYLYPTGQPFWFSAAQLRRDLNQLRDAVDPHRGAPALDQMVLVGHSMGGLVSKLQSVDSGRAFWRANSDRVFAELDADPQVRQALASTYFFRPHTSIRRVVTIGTPHRGSAFANDLTRWLGKKLITAPMRIIRGRQELVARNKGYFRPDSSIHVRTSIDSLAPDSPLLLPLLEATPGPWVKYHNIAGRAPDTGWGKLLDEAGDGVVSLASAQLDGMPQLASQVIVPADHLGVHRHPQSIFEVRRILLEQAAELDNPRFHQDAGVQFAGESEDLEFLHVAETPSAVPPTSRK